MNNIVVFGCDNSGKSTLCQQLSEMLNEDADFTSDFMHTPGPVSLEEMKKYMEDNLVPKGSRHTRVFDRFPILEESIYGPLLRGESKFKDQEYNKKLLDKVDLFIYCYPGLFTILNWGEREQYPGVKDNALEIINRYNKLAFGLRKAGYKVKEYNYKVDDYRRLLDD